jgi:tetratricopeptide (TPR) repeat protein
VRFLEDVLNPNGRILVRLHSETNGVGSLPRRESITHGAGVPEITDLPQQHSLRLEGLTGKSATFAFEDLTQGRAELTFPHGPRQGLRGTEARAGHQQSQIAIVVFCLPDDKQSPGGRVVRSTMENQRLETLKEFIEMNPRDCFARYGVAQEHIKRGDNEQALEQFSRIFEINPDYQAAYFHAGKAYERIGQIEQARQTYKKGIELASRSGDLHARSELEAALNELA